MVPTSGYWWSGGWRDKRNVGARVNRVFLRAYHQTATLQAVEYQLEADAD